VKVKAKQGKVKGETYDYCLDFMILSAIEKRTIIKSAKALLRQQRENDALLATKLSKKEFQHEKTI
jgi:hypothetical protein